MNWFCLPDKTLRVIYQLDWRLWLRKQNRYLFDISIKPQGYFIAAVDRSGIPNSFGKGYP